MSDGVRSFAIRSRRHGLRSVLIDAADVLLVAEFKWYVHSPHGRSMYVHSDVRPWGRVTLHRLLLNPPDGMQVDHINGDGLDNRRANLRIATRLENRWNVGLQHNNTSGYKGVHWHRRGQRWQARYSLNGRRVFIGNFGTVEEAAAAYLAVVSPIHGQFLNASPPEAP